MIKDNHSKYTALRKQFKNITFESFNCSEDITGYKADFLFKIGDKFEFRPTLSIPSNRYLNPGNSKIAESIVFHIGMIELISYWKVVCPREVVIKPFNLDDKMMDFWKKLYLKGMGEFFYTNNIDASPNDFLTIRCESDSGLPPKAKGSFIDEKVLVPVGGGKDSVVTLELLKDHFEVIPFVVNPLKASFDTIDVAGFKREDIFSVNRTIDPKLLELNRQGFLNGHTPFSALIAFVSLWASALSGAKHIALSNESSANEPTVAGGANHQYSKSYEFEFDFRNYYRNYIADDINYFSFLRPLNEYRIAGIFSRFPKYFQVFKSCNRGSKQGVWCGKCPKCLFTYIISSPFLDQQQLEKIFGYDLFSNADLKKYLAELAGMVPVKPFECVGTVDEVNIALQEAVKMREKNLPVLLKYYQENQQRPSFEMPGKAVKNAFNGDNFLEEPFMNILKSALYE